MLNKPLFADHSSSKIRDAYNFLDIFWRDSIPENLDLTDGKYYGDFEKVSYDEAQVNKRKYLLSQLDLKPNMRLLDIGCGYGTLLADAQKQNINVTGITLSEKQARYCQGNGLNVHVMNWKNIPPSWYKKFDCIVSSGSFEHYASPEDAINNLQDKIYEDFFKTCYNLLDPNSESQKLVLTTICFSPPFLPDPKCTLGLYKDQNEYKIYLLSLLFKDSWYPKSSDHVVDLARKFFKVEFIEDGTQDYLMTSLHWAKMIKTRWSFKKVLRMLDLIPAILKDKDVFRKLKGLYSGAWIWQFEGNPSPTILMRTTFRRNKM